MQIKPGVLLNTCMSENLVFRQKWKVLALLNFNKTIEKCSFDCYYSYGL